MLTLPGLVIVDFDFCRFGVVPENVEGEGIDKKRARVMTNATRLVQRLMEAQCPGDH